MTTQVIRVALAGLGAVNRSLLTLFAEKQEAVKRRYNLLFQITAVADSSGAALNSQGFTPEMLQALKANGGQVASLLNHTADHQTFTELLSPQHCDLLFEGTPVNIQTGQPGLAYTRQALQQGLHVVLANKGPLLHDYQELTTLAKANHTKLAYSATVCGALPVINIGQRDLVAAEIRQIRGIFNSTTNYILAKMDQGDSFEKALLEAQHRGIAEADSSLDVDGWDTANKLLIIANSILGIRAKLSDISVEGIRNVTVDQLREARQHGEIIKLIATAHATTSGYRLAVAPRSVASSKFLGSCNGWEMGIELETDIYGSLYHKSREESPLPTAAAMLRDAVNIYRL